ncbi:MAG: hypothetical protein JWM10_4001 [Myxococcaceae bacterium]|nr:hypothetical protein [Myxococcaceae bacterium]
MKYQAVWLLFVLPACGAVAVGPSGSRDAGEADAGLVATVDVAPPVDRGVTPPPDLGFPPTDRGFPSRDVGFPPTDRGFPVRDVGFPPVDDGARVDAGTTSPRAAVVAGRRCTGDDDCASAAAELTCVATAGGSICTSESGCEQGSTAEEEGQCGGRFSTCLTYSTTPGGTRVSLCTRACVVGASSEPAGACPSGSLCTTNWLMLAAAQTENPGCLPFCASDADCAGGDGALGRCNPRLGRCGPAAPDPSARPDGALCNPMVMGQCRGTCFLVSAARGTEGICGSFVNTRASGGGCPDDPTMMPRQPPGDDLGLCIFRDCETNAGCTGEAVCVFPEDSSGVRRDAVSFCGYRSPMQPNGIPGPHD